MTQQEFIREIEKNRRQLATLFRSKLPRIVGSMAKDHFQENFRQSGFVNNGLHKWEPAKRTTSEELKGVDTKYKTLLSSHNNLFNAVQFTPGDSRVTISNPTPYAAAHNFGATIPITKKMRGYAWHQYWENGGRKKGEPRDKPIPEEAELWKGLALTKKDSIKLPQRQFIGDSAELSRKIRERIDTETQKILNR